MVSILSKYRRADPAGITSRTAPPYISITHAEHHGRNVLHGQGALRLVGPLGVNYYVDFETSSWVHLRRFDQEPASWPGQ